MATQDPRIDAYIQKAAPFAQPILRHLRSAVHEGCPEVVETIKWSMPHFEHHGLVAGMAAFKQHCTFGFWNGAAVVGDDSKAREAMGHFGRIASLDDLPPKKTLVALVRKAARLNEQGVKRAAPKRKSPSAVRTPSYFMAALKKNAKALATFENFAPSHKREYIEWLVEAKREETRARRVATAIQWLSDGKTHHWKYERPTDKKRAAGA